MNPAAPESNFLKHLFEDFKCADLIRQQTPIVIDSEKSFNDACNVLIEHRISSAPVYSQKTHSYVGMFDYRDIVEYLLILFHKKNVFPNQQLRSSGQPTDSSTTPYFPHTFNDLYELAISGEPTTVQVASDISGKNPFYSVFPDSPVIVAVDLLSNAGIHRLNVLDSNGTVIGILSQTDILRHLINNVASLSNESVFTKTLLQLGLAPALGQQSQIVAVDAEDTVIHAMQKMSDENVTSVAVLERNGNVIGNISMTDVKIIFQQNQFMHLWMPCAHWVTAVLSQSGLENDGRDRIPVFYVQRETSLLGTIQKILATKVHRIWVEDENGRAIGVVSMSDILAVLLKEYQQIVG